MKGNLRKTTYKEFVLGTTIALKILDLSREKIFYKTEISKNCPPTTSPSDAW
jgi:hypothetical protein